MGHNMELCICELIVIELVSTGEQYVVLLIHNLAYPELRPASVRPGFQFKCPVDVGWAHCISDFRKRNTALTFYLP